MDDEARATGGLDPAHDRKPPRRSPWGRRSPYGSGVSRRASRRAAGATYAALDLGTNNCRLLVARPTGDAFRVIDAFSRIIRLGEGISASGRISDAAIARAVEALGDLPRQDEEPRRHPRAPDRDRGLPRGGERRRIPRPHRRGGRARARDHRPRDRGRACRHRLHAADRSRCRRRDPVRHRRRLVRTGAARPLGAVPARAAAAGDRGLGVDAGRRGDAGRAPRRPRRHARDLRGDGAGGRRPSRAASSPPTTSRRSTACICSAPPAR